jgi:hypothetical protein
VQEKAHLEALPGAPSRVRGADSSRGLIDVSAICSAGAAGETPGGPDLGTRAAAIVK